MVCVRVCVRVRVCVVCVVCVYVCVCVKTPECRADVDSWEWVIESEERCFCVCVCVRVCVRVCVCVCVCVCGCVCVSLHSRALGRCWLLGVSKGDYTNIIYMCVNERERVCVCVRAGVWVRPRALGRCWLKIVSRGEQSRVGGVERQGGRWEREEEREDWAGERER